jgi:signal transduction histidine kinase
VVAEASLALPPGPTSAWPVAVSAVLPVATGVEFLLPWSRLPRWLPVLVPLTYTGSVLALQRALLQDQLRELIVIEDRDRIAADLKDGVIQQIFAAGLTLQGTAGMTTDREVRRRIESAAGELDRAVQILRDTIFGLERRLRGRGFRAELLSVCDGLSPAPRWASPGP